MFLEPEMLGHEDVGLTGWCPVSWLLPRVEGSGPRPLVFLNVRMRAPQPLLPSGVPLAVVFAFCRRRGAPWLSPPTPRSPAGFLAASEAGGIELGAGLPGPPSPSPRLASLP